MEVIMWMNEVRELKEPSLSAGLTLWPYISSTQLPQEAGVSNTIWEQRGEVLAQGCTASEWQSQDKNPGLSVLGVLRNKNE